MKTADGGLHWETISPDLTGAAHDGHDDGDEKLSSPPTVENAKRAGYGVVFTIAPSGLNRDLIWAGSDTGLIHLTRDGGKNWKDVTPRGLSDWSKISLIEASHFDPAVAYAAVDRGRARRSDALHLSHARLRGHVATDHGRHYCSGIFARRSRRPSEQRAPLRRNRVRSLRVF